MLGRNQFKTVSKGLASIASGIAMTLCHIDSLINFVILP